MKQSMDNQSVKALIKYRTERANDTLLEAKTLIENSFYNAAVNRLYYACFYLVSALLVKYQINAQTHVGVKQMFGLHFIVSQKLPAKYGRFYNQLFNDRITGDYDDFITYDKEMLDEIYPKANEFIKELQKFISKN